MSNISEFAISGISGGFVLQEYNATSTTDDTDYSLYLNNGIGICVESDIEVCSVSLDSKRLNKLKSYINQYVINKAYRHWKNSKLYYAHALVLDTFGNEFILYQGLYKDYQYFLRPVDEFLSKIPENREKENVCNTTYRFEIFM